MNRIGDRNAIHRIIKENLPEVRKRAFLTSSIFEQKIMEWNLHKEPDPDDVVKEKLK